VGVVASSISSRDLEGFLRVDLIKLINSVDVEMAQAALPRITIMLTEGLGTMAMPMRTVDLLKHYRGSIGLLSGATSVRQGIFPELVISLPASEIQPDWQPPQPAPSLKVGVQVRISSGEYEGAIGIVDYLFTHEQVFSSGIRARAAHVRLESGTMITAPLTLLEVIS
jgi:transcription antitermination factor NusG